MKNFEEPVIKVSSFETADVITTSIEDIDNAHIGAGQLQSNSDKDITPYL